jgi:hypothetical protein
VVVVAAAGDRAQRRGDRLALLRGAMVTRQWKREVISRCYNLLIKALFGNRFSDAQCNFKAINRGVAHDFLPEIADGEWFFDTELLLLAEERGHRVSEVPVDWIEDLDTRVELASTATKDVKRLLRVRAERLRRRLLERRRRRPPDERRDDRVRRGVLGPQQPGATRFVYEGVRRRDAETTRTARRAGWSGTAPGEQPTGRE